jgi:hypothetical protein
MPFTALITLTIAGTDTGPFDLYSNIDGFTVPFENNVAKLDLEAGYVSTLIPDSTETVRVQSDNVLCSNFVDLPVPSTTTTTSTSTSTSTTTTTSTSTSTTTSTTTTVCTETFVGVDNILSLDIPITGVSINGVPVVYSSGTNFPINAGFSGTFTTNQIGPSNTIEVTYGAATAGQKITIIDSLGIPDCNNIGIGGGTVDMTSAEVNCSVFVQILGEDGTC